MRMPLASRVILYVLSGYMIIGAHVADWRTHLHSPRWPPHAKFHDGQTLCFAIFLGVMTCLLADRRTNDRGLTMVSAVGFASAFWVTQYFAILYPGTAFVDPEYDTPSAYIPGFHAQPVLDVTALVIIAVAAWLSLRESANSGGATVQRQR